MTPPLFHLAGIRFGYDPSHPVLRGAEFSLAPGERVALTGRNGCGKTTLLHLMLGLLRPQAGSVEAFGAPRRTEAAFRAVRARAGLLFQDSDDQLFCPTVAEDVAFGPLNLGKSRSEAADIVTDTLTMLGLAGFERRITYQLSGGEKRLVALATVLAMAPEALLLDEPCNGLDAGTEDRLITILAGLPQAMVLISHDAAFLDRLAHRRVELRDGRLI
ncbi:MAG: ATP-binding cassette domain-containing protein [Azospirillum sp.]|nr:ATP-binding cassette domain-containing protein [Azospirillum sp.]